MKKLILFFLIVFTQIPLCAETTRSDLAKIRVSKEGNFKYWKQDSQVIQKLKAFVNRVTDPKSTDFVPTKDRIVTLDVDGTLSCETAPYYFNWLFTFHRYLHDDTFQSEPGDKQLMQEMEDYVLANHTSKPEWGLIQQKLQAKAFRGMTFKEFSAYLNNYLETEPVKGFTNLKSGTALYWPMIEVVSYLVENDFKVFLCSGVDRDICRVILKDIYDIPPYQMMTSDVNYVMHGQGQWIEQQSLEDYKYNVGEQVERGDFKQLCTAANKIVYMRRELGIQPIMAWGNSSGDYPMFHYTQIDNPRPSICFCLLCDDTVREFGNPAKAEKCRKACDENDWVAVSMRDEWTTIYGDDVKRCND